MFTNKRRSRSETRSKPVTKSSSLYAPTPDSLAATVATHSLISTSIKALSYQTTNANNDLSDLKYDTKLKSHIQLNEVEQHQQQLANNGLHFPDKGLGKRKTSAELINEAKIYLNDVGGGNGNRNVGGVRLINTKRPITPRETGRVLFGKVPLAGRPPSAFSLRYLQHENNRSGSNPLEPIKSRNLDKSEGDEAKGKTPKALPRKLPSLDLDSINPKTLLENENRAKTAVKLAPNPEDEMVDILLSRKLVTKNYDLLGQSSTEKLIEMLKEHSGLKDCSEEIANHVSGILVELYNRVRQNQKGYKKGFVLGGLYGLVETNSPKILLGVARVVLALKVTGSNLTGACKLIFKVARHEQNDHLFHDNDLLELLIDGLGRASPLDDPEACIYGYGSIRFLTSGTGQERSESKDGNKNWFECLSDLPKKPATAPVTGAHSRQNIKESYKKLNKQVTLVERMARHGAVELMVLHLQMLNEASTTKQLTGPLLHSLYQLSAALRTLADVRQTSFSLESEENSYNLKRPSFKDIQLELACPHLIRAAETAMGELEVQANIIRTLSVLSEDIDCCHAMMHYAPRIGMLLGPCCEIFGNSTEKLLSLFSRMGYILGNIMAKYDEARVQFYHNDAALEYLTNVLKIYSKVPLNQKNANGDSVHDVLVKIIRVIANMSVNAEVGTGLGNSNDLGAILLELLNTTARMMADETTKEKLELQELFHANLGALHNLCYYQDRNMIPAQVLEMKGSLHSVLPELAIELCMALKTCSNDDSQLEIVRVLGNLTRNEKARFHFCNVGGLPLILQRLTKNPKQNYDLKACAMGVIVNLLGDGENRLPFLKLKGSHVLALLLKGALEQDDWFLATIASQALWNLLIDAKSLEEYFDEEVLEESCDLLADYLDEERLFDGCPTTDTLWEEFAMVATDLLERIQAYLDHQDPEDLEHEINFINIENDKNTKEFVVNVHNDNDEDDVYIQEI